MARIKADHFDCDARLRDLTHPLMTGDRAVIATADRDFAVTVNEFGTVSYVRALLAYCRMAGAPSPDEGPSGWIELTATAADLLGPMARHVGLSRFEDSPFANQDWGTYTVRGWDVASEDYLATGRSERAPYPMLASLTMIASTQGPSRRAPASDVMAFAAGRGVPALSESRRAGTPVAWVTTWAGDVMVGVSDAVDAGVALAAACAWCGSRSFPSPSRSHYGWARLAECLADWLGTGSLSLRRDVPPRWAERCGRVWVIGDGWSLESPDGVVATTADMARDERVAQAMRELDAAQPHGSRLGMRPPAGGRDGRGMVA